MPGLRPYGFDPGGATSPSLTRRFHSYGRSRFGLDYAVHRFYDPETGRFLQPDPLGQAVYRLEDPQTLNLYSFVCGDPINRRDPLGLDECATGGFSVPFNGGVECWYPAGRAVMQTVVTGQSDAGTLLASWLPQNTWYDGWGPWQMITTKSADQDMNEFHKELRKKLDEATKKNQQCAAARANYYAAANAYARLSYQVWDTQSDIKQFEWDKIEHSFDVAENVAEQLEDPSAGQGFAAGNARYAHYRSLTERYTQLQARIAVLQADQTAVVKGLQAAEAARDAACN
jgi:RHS repeat-associated protein